MAMTGTGTYKKAYPSLRVLTGGVFPFTGGIMVRDKSDIRQIAILRENGWRGILAAMP